MSDQSELIKAISNSVDGYILDSEDAPSKEYAHFYFLASMDGKEIIYDVVLYTLQMHYNSELYELAEEKVVAKFPQYEKMNQEQGVDAIDDLEEEIGLFMAEVILELDEEEAVKVQEHIDVDDSNPVGIGLDVGLNVEEINKEGIMKFITGYSSDTIKLDETYYSFQTDD